MAVFYTGSNMSELLLRLAGDATVRATITSDAQHVFSVYDFMDLACPTKCDSWTQVTWRGLIAEHRRVMLSNSTFGFLAPYLSLL